MIEIEREREVQTEREDRENFPQFNYLHIEFPMDGPGEVMQGVRMLTALPENLNSVPSTYEEQLMNICISSSSGFC